ncbi:AfsR/SARP family transcriptional regulator [Saccharothrix australiensis]|uniref:AfsR/SARP family transcriptional regulator n=1 Tax=Saccharothrix australiensis TaxID=2072 RepID=UPI001476E316|nr:tetratricopeptide repeat protein [Saccharothrix australiensis]
MTIEFRVFGEVEAIVDGRVVDLGPSRQRCVLVALLVDANRLVSLDQLMDRVWGDSPPHSGSNSLHSYLSRLRKALGVAICRQPGGYVLRVDPAMVDLHRFRDLAERARGSDDATAVALLDRALALWRGAAFPVMETPWADEVRTALHRDRLEAVLHRNELGLRGGRHAELVPELLALAAEEPLDERLAGQLMRALCLGGRPAHALEHYELVRRRLSEELGVDPSPALQRVHQQILTGSPALVPADTRPVHALPHDIADFTGRDQELAQLLDTVRDPSGATTVIAAIDGMAGMGKTALAVHAAHRLSSCYPDVQLFIDLHAHTADRQPVDTAAALGTLLRSVGVPGERIPAGLDERAALWRSTLAGRKALVVFDNVVSAAHVRPLLPGGPRCLALVTSRRRLTDLDSARTLSLDVLPHRQAVALFTRVLGDERREPGAVGEVVGLCGHLPLAIRIAAARLRSRPVWTVGRLAGRLRAGLSELATGDRSVVTALHLSYRQLTEAQQRLFRLLGLHPGADFDGWSAAALTAAGVVEVERTLEELVDLHLLQEPEPGRYRMHDLLRAFAVELTTATDSAQSRHAARTRLRDRYLSTAARAVDVVAPGDDHVRPPADLPGPALSGYAEAMAWLERERENLVATAIAGAHSGELSTTLLRYLDLRGYHDDALALHGHAYATARGRADAEAECQALGNLGTACERLGRYDSAEKHHRNALDLARSVGALPLEGRTHNNLANVYLAVADHHNALVHYRQALDIAVRTGNRVGQCRSANNLGIVHERLGQYDEAAVQHTEALTVAEQVGDVAGRGYALHSLGFAYRRLGRADEALGHFRQAVTIAEHTANRSLEGYTRLGLGLLLADLGRFAESAANLHNALSVASDTGNRGLRTEALNGLGELARRGDDPARALVHHREALALAEETGDRYQQARAHDGLAHAQHALDRRSEARRHWRSALTLYVAAGVPEADPVRVRLSTAG